MLIVTATLSVVVVVAKPSLACKVKLALVAVQVATMSAVMVPLVLTIFDSVTPFDGLALGGLGVGEPPPVMHDVVAQIAPEMPPDRPRYLMGVGTPIDIWKGIGAGIDMFDCVMPTRNARNGQLFIRGARLNIANAQHRDDARPVEEGCPCECCRRYSRAYLSHLFHARELLYYRLATVHNLQHYLDLARRARGAILSGHFPEQPW